MKKAGNRSECPLSCSLDVFGDKWSLLIIRDMMFYQKSSYGDFLKSAEGIATNILASRLQSLEENGLVERLEHPNSRAKVLYRLTEKSIDLLPIIVEVHLWAEKYLAIPPELKNLLKEVKKGKDAYIKAKQRQLRKELVA
jgi:DNA-binding HxlR family transcriptional regulator